MQPRALIFDAYGTFFDVHSAVVLAAAGIAGDPLALSHLWRRKQLELTWLRALMERYEDFWHITEAALRSALRELSIQATDRQMERLMSAWLSPAPFPDAVSALESLRETSKTLAILSNGSPAMLDLAVRNSGLGSYFAEIVSVDSVRTYKPSPRVYALGPETLRLSAAEILFVSSNWWDVAGAKAFGYQVCWCNRSGADAIDPDFAPDFTVHRLDRIADKLGPATQSVL